MRYVAYLTSVWLSPIDRIFRNLGSGSQPSVVALTEQISAMRLVDRLAVQAARGIGLPSEMLRDAQQGRRRSKVAVLLSEMQVAEPLGAPIRRQTPRVAETQSSDHRQVEHLAKHKSLAMDEFNSETPAVDR